MASTMSAPLSGPTAWARNLAAPVRDFLSTETGGAVVLLAAAIAALAWANGPWPNSYESVWTTELSLRLGDSGITLELREWVKRGPDDVLLPRRGTRGQARARRRRSARPQRRPPAAGAALGGMVLAVLIYLAFNVGSGHADGWGAAMSTDTAFALGLLALVARGGTRLRVRLLTITSSTTSWRCW
jgi:Na+/H+ antiporter NhaA